MNFKFQIINFWGKFKKKKWDVVIFVSVCSICFKLFFSSIVVSKKIWWLQMFFKKIPAGNIYYLMPPLHEKKIQNTRFEFFCFEKTFLNSKDNFWIKKLKNQNKNGLLKVIWIIRWKEWFLFCLWILSHHVNK